MPNKIVLLLWTLLLIPCANAAAPLPTHDSQLWTNLTVTGAVDEESKIRYWLETQARFGEDFSTLSQYLFRPGVGYAIHPNVSVWLGYAWIYTTLPFAAVPFEENRIWQQVVWTGRPYKLLQLTSRTRIEERFLPRDITAMRIRQQLRAQLHFSEASKFSLIATEEVFFHLANPNQEGFDQNRAFVGLGYQVTDNALMEVGYLNQALRRANGSEFSGNYLSLVLLINL